DTDSQSDVLRAAGIGITENNPTEPVLTLRIWVLGVVFCIVACGLNILYTLRSPVDLSSGYMEYVLIYVMSNLSIYVRLGADVLTEQEMFYGYKAGWGFQFLITLATF
ncbi:hypothetical protein NUU61_000019, partial [Penicillium alfredii]